MGERARLARSCRSPLSAKMGERARLARSCRTGTQDLAMGWRLPAKMIAHSLADIMAGSLSEPPGGAPKSSVNDMNAGVACALLMVLRASAVGSDGSSLHF